MEFQIRRLGVLSYHNGFTLWVYQAGTKVSDVLEKDFFKNCSDLLKKGDMIMVSATDGGATVFVESADFPDSVVVKPIASSNIKEGS